MKLTAGRELGGGENDGGVAKGLQVEASVGVALQIQRGDDLRRRLPLLRARERHGLDYLVGGSPWPYSFSPGVFLTSQSLGV